MYLGSRRIAAFEDFDGDWNFSHRFVLELVCVHSAADRSKVACAERFKELDAVLVQDLHLLLLVLGAHVVVDLLHLGRRRRAHCYRRS